eukprot:TRINITY_DN1055_c0_g1_i2.p1 TRINITY_DN1055_c0_g1~~TRINITY_DN1055_c0_g1_i2.p1  ORF type:complete len:309 (+),score=46.15 TRINITY_DN1055_c0_g1_i2:101-1027(+)
MAPAACTTASLNPVAMAPAAGTTAVSTCSRARRAETHAEAEATVFIGNIGRGITQRRVRTFLEEHYGNVRSVRLVFDCKTRHHRGFGFAMFHDPGTAQRFIRDYGASWLYLDGVRIKVGMRDKVLSSSSGSGTGGCGSDADAARGGRRPPSGSGSGSASDSEAPPVLCDSDSSSGGPSSPLKRSQQYLPRALPAPPPAPPVAVAIPQALPLAQGLPTALPAPAAAVSPPAQAVPAPPAVTHGVSAGQTVLAAHATAVPFVVAARPQVPQSEGQLHPTAGFSAVTPAPYVNGGFVSTIPLACIPPAGSW